MMAHDCDMKVGELVQVNADAHISDRQVHLVRELIDRKQYPAPAFWLNPEVHDFYQFTREDVKVEGYETGGQIVGIPVAV